MLLRVIDSSFPQACGLLVTSHADPDVLKDMTPEQREELENTLELVRFFLLPPFPIPPLPPTLLFELGAGRGGRGLPHGAARAS